MTSRLVDAGLRASGFWINNMRGQFVKELIFSFFVFTPFGYNLKGKKKKQAYVIIFAFSFIIMEAAL